MNQARQGAARNPRNDGIAGQAEIQHDDEHGRAPGQNIDPGAVGELAHAAAVAGETDQRNDGEGKLHAQDHLAQDQQPIGSLIAAGGNGDHRRDNRDRAGDQAAQPRSHAQVQKSFHDDLPGVGSGERGRLAAGQQRDREQSAGEGGSQQRREQLVSLLNLSDDRSALEKDRRGHHQDGGVHDQRAVQRDEGIDKVIPAGDFLFRGRFADAARLHQRGMQIEIVRHHRRAQHADGDVEAGVVQARHEPEGDIAK